MSSLGSFSGPDPVHGVHHASRAGHADPDKKRQQQQKQEKEKRHGDEVDLTSTHEAAADETIEAEAAAPDADDETPPVIHIDVQG